MGRLWKIRPGPKPNNSFAPFQEIYAPISTPKPLNSLKKYSTQGRAPYISRSTTTRKLQNIQ
jgi:hypothetical protein